MSLDLWPDGYDTGPITGPIEPWYTAREAHAQLGIPPGTVHSWSCRGRLWPVGLDEYRRPLFCESDLLALRDRTRTREEWDAVVRRRQRTWRDRAARRGLS